MKTKPKDLGTRFETFLVNYWRNHKLGAWRLAEEGINDQGDILLSGIEQWTIEAKARANLNVSQTLAKAKEKSGSPWTAVVWKKLTRKGDNQRRSADGEPVVVIMSLDTFTRLIGGE